jgi:hypothetical protein
MSTRRLCVLVDALANGRRWGKFEVDPEDVDVLRTAITFRAARPGDAQPDTDFVSGLCENLKDQMDCSVVPIARPPRRRRVALAAIAAGLVLVAGTATATDVLSEGGAVPTATRAFRGTGIRTGTFESFVGRVLGQILVYGENPSWVVLDIDGSGYTGAITCVLQVEDGSTVFTGAFTLHAGKGEWSKAINICVNRLRGAKLVTPSGAILASATFA